jgi:hypothetical protein
VNQSQQISIIHRYYSTRSAEVRGDRVLVYLKTAHRSLYWHLPYPPLSMHWHQGPSTMVGAWTSCHPSLLSTDMWQLEASGLGFLDRHCPEISWCLPCVWSKSSPASELAIITSRYLEKQLMSWVSSLTQSLLYIEIQIYRLPRWWIYRHAAALSHS